MTILREMVRYGLKGGLQTGLNVALMTGLVELGKLRPAVAAIVSTCTLLVLGYVLMNRFVFPDGDIPDTKRGHIGRAARYYAVILSGKALNYGLFVVLLSIGVWYPLAWVVGAGTVFIGTFGGNRWLWSSKVAA